MKSSGDPKSPQLKDIFSLNKEFKPKSRRCVLKEMKFVEKLEEDETVEFERIHAIQSTLVMIMKSNKILKYGQLVSRCEKLLLKFRPSPNVNSYFLTF